MSGPTRFLILVWCALSLLFLSRGAAAEPIVEVREPRDITLAWGSSGHALYAKFQFHDALDAKIKSKLSRGLPTEIVLTALVFAPESDAPLSTTFQTCRITWHVWEEMYRVDVSRTNQPEMRRHWTPTMSGVLRRCAEVSHLLIADSSQVGPGRTVYLKATVRINPVGEELLGKLKRWVSRPSRTAAAAPGSALFSTFTGLFMQRIGDAERTLLFVTKRATPN